MALTPTRTARILVVEDDEDNADLVRLMLQKAGHQVSVAPSSSEARRLLANPEVRCDLVVTDLNLPDLDGLALTQRLRVFRPGLPVVVMTSTPTVESAVVAVRQGVTDFLVKPFDATALIDAVDRAFLETTAKLRRVLAIGAHPDDVEIGAGATLADHAARGEEVLILTLSRGQVGGDVEERTHEAMGAARILGAELVLADLEDTAITENGRTVGIIEEVVHSFRPDTVYTHSLQDNHQDHRAVHRAAMVGTRSVAQVCCFQSPSTTIDFRPTRFVPVESFVDTKLEALAAYSTQARRSYMEEDLMVSTARYWGRFSTARYAEPFEVIRDGEVNR